MSEVVREAVFPLRLTGPTRRLICTTRVATGPLPRRSCKRGCRIARRGEADCTTLVSVVPRRGHPLVFEPTRRCGPVGAAYRSVRGVRSRARVFFWRTLFHRRPSKRRRRGGRLRGSGTLMKVRGRRRRETADAARAPVGARRAATAPRAPVVSPKRGVEEGRLARPRSVSCRFAFSSPPRCINKSGACLDPVQIGFLQGG